MPAASKRINKTVNTATEEQRGPFYCCRCGIAYGRLKGNFGVSHSPMYRGRGHLPFCNRCVDEMYEIYRDKTGSNREAMRYICMKLDLYWHPSLYDMVEKKGDVKSYVRSYIGKTNMYKFVGKSFDDTLNEEDKKRMECVSFSSPPHDEIIEESIPPEMVAFWGSSLPPDFYAELEQKYKTLTAGRGTIDLGEQAIFKQICMLEVRINRDTAAGKPIDKHVNSLNTLLGSANMKPAQKKGDELDAELENMPFGVGIRKWENTRPVPDTDPELRDADGIIKYVTVWFLGHLCKMLGIRNSYCKLYEDELERLRVNNPEFEDDDDETLFNNIFGGDST